MDEQTIAEIKEELEEMPSETVTDTEDIPDQTPAPDMW